jgi:hypothetical protein
MNNLDSFEIAARVLNKMPPPVNAVINQKDEDAYFTLHSFSSAVKYVARYTSVETPDGYERIDGNYLALQHAFRGVLRDRLPLFFRQMVEALLAGSKLRLPTGMYQAAFATEIAFLEDGPTGFINKFNTDKNFDRNIVFNLLDGAGYNVTIGQD